MRCAKVIDRAYHEHPLVQRPGVAGQRPATPRQRREAFPKRGIEPVTVALVQLDGNMFFLPNESFMPFACGKFRPPTAAFRSLPKRQRGLLGS